MAEKLGIDNIKMAVEGASKLASVVVGAVSDGLSIADIGAIVPAIKALSQLAKVDYKAVLAEIKDLDAQEQEILAKTFKEKFDIPQDNIEEILERGLDIVMAVALAVLKLINSKKK